MFAMRTGELDNLSIIDHNHDSFELYPFMKRISGGGYENSCNVIGVGGFSVIQWPRYFRSGLTYLQYMCLAKGYLQPSLLGDFFVDLSARVYILTRYLCLIFSS